MSTSSSLVSPYSSYSDPRHRTCPPIGAPESELLAYRDRVINRWSVYRNMHMGRIALAVSYFLGRQWSELDYEAAFDGVRGVALRDAASDDIDPVRPVTNEIDPAVEAEVIALVKRRWTPKMTPTSSDPRIKAAAQVANDMVNYRLEQLAWREKRHQLGLHFATMGTGLIYTSWDRSYADLKPVGAPSAVWCEACGTKLYSRDVPVDTLKLGIPGDAGASQPVSQLESASPIAPGEDDAGIEEARLEYCPTCPEPHSLVPYEVNEEEAESGVDVFGRPLGDDAARGASTLEIDLPWEFHPQNGGARVTPDMLRRFGRRKIRDLEWIEERYPHIVHEISPDTVSDLLYGDPLLGSWDILGSYSSSLDSGIFDYHANVDEIVEQPSFREPLGRYVVCTKDKVLEDGALLEHEELEDVDGSTRKVYVPRAQISVSRFKLRPGELWGTTLADHEISKQNRLNGLDAQIISTRLRMGPNVFMPEDMWPAEGPVMDTAEGMGNFMFLKPSLQNPGFSKPEIFNGILMPDGVYQERDRVQADIKRGVGPQDASQGMAPKGVGTTSGLQLLVEQDERSRSLREDELVNSAEKSWSHLLQMEWVLRVDEDTYRVLGPNKAWKYAQYKGSALRGQVEVKIERGSFIAKSVVNREGAREALADQVVLLDSPMARRRMLEMYGLDTDINEDTNNQVDHAERVWVDFVDKGLVRPADSIDNAAIHHAVLGAHLRTEEGERLAEQSGWDATLRIIAGWEDELRQMATLEAKSIAFYGGRLTGEDAKVAFAKATIAYQQQSALYEQQRKINEEMQQTQARVQQANSRVAAVGGMPSPSPVAAMPPPPLGDPPVPPTPPVELPQLMQDRVILVWKGMMAKADVGPQAPPPSPEVDDALHAPARDPMVYVSFRALVDAYKITAALGGAAPPAPGSGATMAPVDKGGPAMSSPAPAAAGGGGGKVPGPPPTGPMPGGGAN